MRATLVAITGLAVVSIVVAAACVEGPTLSGPVSSPSGPDAAHASGQALGTTDTGSGTGFPFGYYGLEYPAVLNTGFSPRVYIDSGMKPDGISEVLDLAASGGVQVYQYIPPGALSLPLSELRDRWLLPAFGYSPSVMAGVYLAEEPSAAEIPAMVDLLTLVHELDPHGRPVLTYLGYYSNSNIQRYVDTVDIDLLGAYPVYKEYPQGFMTGVMDGARQVLWPAGKRFYAVPETFGPILDHPQGPLLLRNNVYQGIIGGADGIIFYEESGFDSVAHPLFFAELERLREEIVGSGKLGAVALCPDPPQVVGHRILSGPTDLIEMDMFEYTRWYERLQYHLELCAGDLYLFTANIAGETLEVEFGGLPTLAEVEVLFEERSISLGAGGGFRDTFGPYEVHIYRAQADLPPGFSLVVDQPGLGFVTNSSVLTVTGHVTPVASVEVNGSEASVAADGVFSYTLELGEGMQVVRVSTISAAVSRRVTLDTQAPDTSIIDSQGDGVPPFSFQWIGTDSGSGAMLYSYRIDQNAWSLWTSRQGKTYDGEEYAALNLASGHHTFQVRARDRSGNVDPTPAEAGFDVLTSEPPESGAIAGPGSGRAGIACTFVVTATDPDGDRVACRLFWDDGTESGWSELVPSGTPIAFSHAWSEGGRYFVRAQARDEHGLSIPWSQTVFHSVSIVGKVARQMPFGYYGLEYPQVMNTGFSPRVYIDSAMQSEAITEVMDIAASGGVQVYQYIPSGALSLPRAELAANWLEPAVGYGPEVMAGFYVAEEPGESEIPAMVSLLDRVHEVDPHQRPVATYLGYYSTSNIERFARTVDIDLLGVYPVYKGYPQAFATGVMDSGRQALWPLGKRFYAVQESFGPILTDPQGPRLLRNSVYQSVIGGADGIMFYDASGFDAGAYPAYYAELESLRDEFLGDGGLGAVLLSPAAAQVVTHTIVSGPTDPVELTQFEYSRFYDRTQYRLLEYEGDTFLLAANVSDSALEVMFSGLPIANVELDVLFEDRRVSMERGAFQDAFAPFEVHVYRGSYLRQYLPRVVRDNATVRTAGW